jgi:NADP-dependent 3-hydroxy acid dehydrogenase YdfG
MPNAFLPLAVDLNNVDCIDESVQQTIAAFGRIDVVVNNAGYGMTGTIEGIAEQDIRNIFDVNVLASINVTKSILPLMRKQRSGYIINYGFGGLDLWEHPDGLFTPPQKLLSLPFRKYLP